jgi:stage V sporulation protein R
MDKFINPPDYMEEQKKKMERERDRPKKNPAEPERDVLMFLLQNAPLEPWERDILEIVRDEAYYFAPQRQTKILNEGWAAYWHSRIMTERALKVSEIIDYADHNAGVLATAPGQFNPYKIGIELLRDIEERWDKGRFGREWNECQNLDQRRVWDKRLGLGRKKIFEVRKLYNDVTFIDEFFTSDFCERNRFFSFSLNDRTGNYEIDSREFEKIKHKMLFSLTNFGDPFIMVEDSNHDNRGELLMRHRHEGTDLQIDHARATLTALVRIWRRPVNLLTAVDGKQKLFRYDGKEQVEKSIGN